MLSTTECCELDELNILSAHSLFLINVILMTLRRVFHVIIYGVKESKNKNNFKVVLKLLFSFEC